METKSNSFNKIIKTPIVDLVYGKVPPQAVELEKAVIGACLLEPNAFERVISILNKNCFYVDAHQNIFEAMEDLFFKHSPIDTLTLVEQLASNGKLSMVGGPYAITKITDGVVSAANIEAHARIVVEKYIGRELIRISGETLNNSYNQEEDVFDNLDAAEEALSTLRNINLKGSYKSIQQVVSTNIIELEDLRHRNEAFSGVPTGFEDLDRVTCGWQNTDLIILAARPSVGKTALSLTLAKAATKSQKKTPVGFFTLEMQDKQLVNRVLSQESQVWMWKFKNGKFSDEEMKSIYDASNSLSTAKIFIDDTPGLSIQDFRTKARQMKNKEGVGLIIIDYLQLMTVRGSKTIREQEISKISRELKETAKELNLPIIALSQLSRDIEKSEGKEGKREPKLSDLRESGAIEQDADMVMMLYKPTEYEVSQDPTLQDAFYNKIVKHRSGSLEKFIGKFVGETQTHEYLKVVDKNSLMPLGKSWKPVNNIDFSQAKKDKEVDDEMPF